MTDQMRRQPIFNAPTSVLVVLGLLVAAHVARTLLPDGTSFRVILALALIPGRAEVAEDLPGGVIAVWTQFLTHVFVHGDLTHLLVNCAWLLIFGTVMARRLSPVRFAIYFAGCALAGGFFFDLAHRGEMQPMVGASGAVSGLMGGVLRLLFPAIDLGSPEFLNHYARRIPRMTLGQALTDRRVLSASAVVLGINLALATSFGSRIAGGGIAWEAHVGGFLAGFFLLGLIDDGPLGRLTPPPRADQDGDEPPGARS